MSMVHTLSKKEAPRHAVANSGPLMVSLVRVMDSSGDVETVRAIAGTLHNLSSTRWDYEIFLKVLFQKVPKTNLI